MKKSNHISAYLTDETLKLLQEYALEHRWTLSTATSCILEDFLKERLKAPPAAAVNGGGKRQERAKDS